MLKKTTFFVLFIIFALSQSAISQEKPKHNKTEVNIAPMIIIEPETVTIPKVVITTDDLRQLYEKTFDTETGKTLTASSVAGDIEISTWDRNEFQVKIMGNDEAERKLIFDAHKTDEGAKIDCGQKRDENMNNLDLKIIVNIPSDYNVDLFTGGGNINVADLKGSIKMNTSGGNIEIDRSNGSITAFTSGGNISTENNTGNIELSTSGGMITALNFTGNINASTLGGHIILKGSDGSIKASTSGGNIKIDYTGPNDGIDASTLGGNIVANLPSDFSADADIGTLAGRVDCEFTKVENRTVSTFLKTKFNNGGKTFKCITSGGNIVITKK